MIGQSEAESDPANQVAAAGLRYASPQRPATVDDKTESKLRSI